MIDAKTVRELLDYCPETGIFTWKVGREPAGYKHKYHGYIVLTLFDKRYMTHRLAWLYVHGEWPSGEIDHINLEKTDNRIANLRIAGMDLGKVLTDLPAGREQFPTTTGPLP
jgi:hypothetical protein